MENPKICIICSKIRSNFIISDNCGHKFCSKCLISSLEKDLPAKGLPFPCLIPNCKEHLNASFLKKILPNEDYEELFENLKTCTFCLKEFPREALKKRECKHKSCASCKEDEKCLVCLKKRFLNQIKEKIEDGKPSFSSGKKKCAKCEGKTVETERLSCCEKRICLDCLKNSFNKQIKKEEKNPENQNFSFFCPFCEAECDELLVSSVLEPNMDKKYRKLASKRKCEVCLLNKERTEIRKIGINPQHRVCKDCIRGYFETLRQENSDFPENCYCLVEDCREILKKEELFEEFEEISGLEKKIKDKDEIIERVDNYEEDKEEIKLEVSPKIENNKPILPFPQNLNSNRNFNLQCKICLFEKSMEEIITLECEHKFCQSCISEYCEGKINSGQVSNSLMLCPEQNCGKTLNYYIVKDNVSKEHFQKFDSLLTESALFQDFNKSNPSQTHKISPEKNTKPLERLITCPKCLCYFTISTDSQYFICSICKIKYCANENCRRKWSEHSQKKCHELAKIDNEKEFLKYIKQHKLQTCPMCFAIVEKVKNCNYIVCESLRCQKKTTFCYLCGKLLEKNELSTHYLNNSQFSNCKIRREEQKNEKEIEKDQDFQEILEEDQEPVEEFKDKKKGHLSEIDNPNLGKQEILIPRNQYFNEYLNGEDHKFEYKEKKNNPIKNAPICLICKQSLLKDHAIWIGVGVEGEKKGNNQFMYCKNMEEAYCTDCPTVLKEFNSFQTHIQKHQKREFSRFELYSHSYNELSPMTFGTLKNEKDIITFELYTLCGNEISKDQRVVYFKEMPIPIIQNQLILNLLCRECNQYQSVVHLYEHLLKEIEENKRKEENNYY